MGQTAEPSSIVNHCGEALVSIAVTVPQDLTRRPMLLCPLMPGYAFLTLYRRSGNVSEITAAKRLIGHSQSGDLA